MSALATFITSLAVSILCAFLGGWQTHRFVAAIEDTVPLLPVEGSARPNNPDIRRSYVEQLVEIAYAFPSLLLTILALNGLFIWWGDVFAYVVVGAVGLSLLLVWLGAPENAKWISKARIGSVSLVGLSLILVNIGGIVWAACSQAQS